MNPERLFPCPSSQQAPRFDDASNIDEIEPLDEIKTVNVINHSHSLIKIIKIINQVMRATKRGPL